MKISMHALRRVVARWSALMAACSLALTLAGCDVQLYSGLNEAEANEIIVALASTNIPARKERVEGGDWQVQVDQARLGAALEVLRAQGLPHERFVSMGDLFAKQGLVSTPGEERMRYIYAVSQELSQTLRSIDGVVSARVHVVVPSNDPLSDKIKPSSAAVFIKHRPDVDLRMMTPAVKDLVAHSIEGLNPDQVSLSLFPSARVASVPTAAVDTRDGADARLVFGVMSTQAAVVGILLLVMVAISLMVLPALLRRRGLDWRTWLQREVLRR